MRSFLLTLLCGLSLCGCASRHESPESGADFPAPILAAASDTVGRGLSDMTGGPGFEAPPQAYPPVEAMVAPPPGWQPDPLKRTSSHAHQVWVSPSGNTANGVIRMNLPFPFIGPDMVLKPFLEEMRRTEGKATLLSRRPDRRLPGIRFVAEGGEYKIRTNLLTRGYRAWAVYAGTRQGSAEVPQELELAEQARERTKIGLARSRS